MRARAAIAALGLAVAGPAAGQSTDQGRTLVERGRALFQAGEYEEAARALWDATRLDEAVGTDTQLQILRARAMMQSGRPENAIRLLEQVGGDNEGWADSLYWQGQAWLMMTEDALAAETFRTALEYDPDHAQAQEALSYLPAGLTVPEEPDIETVEAAPTETIEAEPAAPVREAAPEPAREPAAPPPPAPPAPDEEANAAPPLRAQRVIVPDDTGPVRLTGPAAPASEPAQTALAEAAAPEPEPESDPELEPAAAAVPEPEPAETQTAEEAGPAPEVAANVARGRSAFASGDYAGAAAYLWRATEADPAVRDNAEIQTLRARAVAQAGDPETALIVFDNVATSSTGPDRAEALYWRGETQAALGRTDAAARSWNRALAAEPGHDGAQTRLAALAEPEAEAEPLPEPEPEPEPEAPAAPAPPAPESEPEPEPPAASRAEAAPAPPDAEPAPEPAPEASAPAGQAAVDRYRSAAAEARAAGDRAGEVSALSELYLTQLADPGDIARYAELMQGEASADIGRDFQIARLAGLGAHYDLAEALYRAVERAGTASGEIAGRNLAILRANLATMLLEAGRTDEALETAGAALEADETYANAWGVRAMAYRQDGDLGRALEDAKQAFDLGVRAPEVLELLQAAGFAVDVPAPPPQAQGAPLRGSQE